MRAEHFKPAAELGFTEVEREAMITLLHMLERGEIADADFDMASPSKCLCAWANKISGGLAFSEEIQRPLELLQLFWFERPSGIFYSIYSDRTHSRNTAAAAIALRDYLVTGEARWAEALASAAVKHELVAA